jgi:hypothetical protein
MLRIPDLEPSLAVAPMLQLGYDSFQVLLAGQTEELDAVPLAVIGMQQDDGSLRLVDRSRRLRSISGRSRRSTPSSLPRRIRTDYLSVQLALSHLPVPLTVTFMAWPFAVPLETTENFSNSELGASATIVLADLLLGSLHSTLASNLPDEVLVTVILQDFAMPVGLKLIRSSFLIQL